MKIQSPRLAYQLPDFYSEFFPRPLLEAPLQEKLATCDACAEKSYRPDLKCCTYHPFQPNFLIGAALKNQRISNSAVQVIERKVQAREYVLPIGIVAPVPHQVEFNARDKSQFGQREDWLCPYYDRQNQNCGIWKYRGAVCTTFFCKSSYGKKGMEFWERLSDYLTYVEMALLEEALVMLDFSPRQMSENLEYLNRFDASPTELKMKVLPEALARKIWNGYFEDPMGFYVKCFAIISEMNKKQFNEAMGEQGLMLQKELMKSLKGLNL